MEQTLGNRIAENRKRLKLTQEQLAEKLGVTAQAVSKWENDQSCPDIGTLPRLSQIFGISTDALLGCEAQTVHTAQVVEDEDDDHESDGFHIHSDHWDISLGTGKHSAIGGAVCVILVGILYLLNHIFGWNISFWNILWPTGLLVMGLSELIKRFSFVPLACALTGGFFLAQYLLPVKVDLKGGYIIALLIVLFGISLLIDALKKDKKHHVHISPKVGAFNHHNVSENSYDTQDGTFSYHASFGESSQLIELPCLEQGTIETSFGRFTVNLSGVETVRENSQIKADNCFGQLIILVPRRFLIKSNSSTAFASIRFEGQPDPQPAAVIYLEADTAFGQIVIEYI